MEVELPLPSFKLFLLSVWQQQNGRTFQERLCLSDLFLFGLQFSDAVDERSQQGHFGPLGPQFVLTALLLCPVAVDRSQTLTVFCLHLLQVSLQRPLGEKLIRRE